MVLSRPGHNQRIGRHIRTQLCAGNQHAQSGRHGRGVGQPERIDCRRHFAFATSIGLIDHFFDQHLVGCRGSYHQRLIGRVRADGSIGNHGP